MYRWMIAICLLAMTVPSTYAQTPVDENDMIGPDSMLYEGDVVLENVVIRLTDFVAGKSAGVETRMGFAKERLKEADEMAQERNNEGLQKALQEHDRIIADAEDTINHIDEDEKGIERATQAIERHRERMNEQKGVILHKVDDDAKEAVEKAFDNAISKSEKASDRLNSIKSKQKQNREKVFNDVEDKTGIDVEDAYENAKEGEISPETVDNTIEYINANYNLSQFEGETACITLKGGDTICAHVVDGVLVEGKGNTVDYRITLTEEDIQEYASKIGSGKISKSWALKEAGDKIGVKNIGKIRNIVKGGM